MGINENENEKYKKIVNVTRNEKRKWRDMDFLHMYNIFIYWGSLLHFHMSWLGEDFQYYSKGEEEMEGHGTFCQ